MLTSAKTFNHSSKTHALSEHLAAMATELGPDAKLPTIQELRRELNVSISTLDNALTQLEGQKVIYRKHGVGIFVSPHVGKKSIALVCDPSFLGAGTSPFWQEMIEGAQAYGADKGESCRFFLAMPSAQKKLPVPDDLVEDVKGKRLDGVLFIGDNKPAVEWILNQGIPVVTFAGWSHWMVEINYPEVVRAGLKVLDARQCREVGLLLPYLPDGEGNYIVPHAGIEIFEAEAKALGMTYQADWIWDFHQYPQHRLATTPQEQGYNAILTMYGSGAGLADGPKALVSIDDMMTRGALVAMQKLNIRPGQDVQIATHSNRGSSVLQGYESELTRLEIDPGTIVTAMFTFLESLLEGQAMTPRSIFVGPQVI
jgi:DNA-binding LacI/PurR family transcriptional regulator